MLNDASLKTLYPTLVGVPLPTDPDNARSPIQPASIDLSVGEVYEPDTKTGTLGAVGSPHTKPFILERGHTAVVTTLETLSVPATHGAIGFPPTTISNDGILMTNPGHVDPGYRGRLTFTVINMGRRPFELRPGDRIVTMLFFELSAGAATSDYEDRHPSQNAAPPPAVTADRMARLAPDMLDIDRRVKEKTDAAESKTRRISIWVPLALAAVVGAGTVLAPIVSNLVSQNAELQRRISVLEDRKNREEIQSRLDRLEQQASATQPPPTQGAPGGTGP